MRLFEKIKDILFVDEEEEIPMINAKSEEKEVKKVEPIQETSQMTRSRSIKRDIEPKNIEIKPEIEPKVVHEEEKIVERPIKKESPFLSFDEEEFDRINRHVEQPVQRRVPQQHARINNDIVRTTTTTTKKTEYKDYSRYEIKKVEEKKPFKLSPVISPVYGVMDKNYVAEVKEEVKPKYESSLMQDVDSVRKKAFGEKQKVVEKPVEIKTIDDEIEPVIPIQKEELPKKVAEKSIDDLLFDSFTAEPVKLDPSYEESRKSIMESLEDENDILDDIEPVITRYDDVKEKHTEYVDEKTSALEILDQIERELNKKEDKPIKKDSLEGDLFNLIDSMYEDGKGDN